MKNHKLIYLVLITAVTALVVNFITTTTPAQGACAVGTLLNCSGTELTDLLMTNLTVNNKFGLGVPLPAEKLEVRDDTAGIARIRITDWAQNPELQLQYGGAAGDHWAIYSDHMNDDSLNIWSYNVGSSPDNRLTILQNGNVGIGTTNPGTNKLYVNGNLNVSGTASANGQALCQADGTNCPAYWTLNGNNLYPNDTNYNVGIGTTNPPGQKLEVAGNVLISGVGNGLTFPDGTTQSTAAGGRYVGATGVSYDGIGVGGYDGGNAKCAADYGPLARMCMAADFANGYPLAANSMWYNTFINGYWYSSTPPVGNIANNDCRGWTTNASQVLGTINGPGVRYPSGSPCSNAFQIACCQ